MSREPTFNSKVSAAEGVLVADAADTCALLNSRTEQFYGLDEVGTSMWAALGETPSIRDAAAALAERYDAPAERIEADLIDFVRTLQEQGLVEIHPA